VLGGFVLRVDKGE